MQFSIVDESAVLVVHQNVEVRFDVGQLRKSNLIMPGKDLFFEINNYMNTLEPHVQFEIFKLYVEIRELRDSPIGVSFNAQQKETTDMVTKLYEYLDLTNLAQFAMRANVVYPVGLISRHAEKPVNTNINENINYYKEDYDGLVMLVIALRPMIPIWGEYIAINKEAVGTQYKEYSALSLISKSALNHSPHMDRLRIYINEWRTTGNTRSTLADDVAVLDGISSDELTNYILGLILVRRLSVCNIHANTDKDSIISSVYSYLKSKLSEAANTFKTNKKYDDGGGREQGEEMSILEKYKISSKLTHGDRVFIKEYARLPVNVAKQLDPDIDLFVLEECLTHNHSLNLSMSTHQRLITQWATYKAFPSQGIYELSKFEVVNLVSVAQALLMQWGLHELALIVTAEVNNSAINVTSSSRTVISDDLLKQLDMIYPYQKLSKRQQDKANIAHDAIYKLSTELTSHMFTTSATASLAERLTLKGDKYNCPVGLVDQLAELLIRVDSIKHITE